MNTCASKRVRIQRDGCDDLLQLFGLEYDGLRLRIG